MAGEQFYGLMGTDRLKWLLSLQFRWANTRRLANPPVDWWLFLLREPFAIEGFEGVRPMHLAVGQVDTGPFLEHGLFRCETGFLCQEWLRSLADCEPDFAAHVAGLNRLDAARLLNGQIAAVLEKLMVEER